MGGEIYYRAIGRPWGPAADFIHVVNVKFHLSAPGRLLSSIRGPPARAIPKFVCPTVRLSVWPRAAGAARASLAWPCGPAADFIIRGTVEFH